MASAWGSSWGSAWGNAWGSVAPSPILVFADRVHQVSNSKGTGNLALGSTSVACRPFSAVLNANDYMFVCMASQGLNQWETNLVQFQADGTLARIGYPMAGIPCASSNGGQPVNFTGSLLDVFGDQPAIVLINGLPSGYQIVVR